MAERKVLNKYFPPDFDPYKLPKRNTANIVEKGGISRPRQFSVRMMMPMTARCLSCNEYIPRGRKFNSRCERIEDDSYLTITKLRFYMRCPRCSAEFTIKTDPENEYYVVEHGVSQNSEPWREAAKALKEEQEKKIEEEKDAMKALENKTSTLKQDVAVLDALDEFMDKSVRARKLNKDALENVVKENEEERVKTIEEEEARLIKEIKSQRINILLEDGSDGSDKENNQTEKNTLSFFEGVSTQLRPENELVSNKSDFSPSISLSVVSNVGNETNHQITSNFIAIKTKRHKKNHGSNKKMRKSEQTTGLALLSSYANSDEE